MTICTAPVPARSCTCGFPSVRLRTSAVMCAEPHQGRSAQDYAVEALPCRTVRTSSATGLYGYRLLHSATQTALHSALIVCVRPL